MQRYNLRTSPFLDFQSPFTAWEAVKMVVLLPLVPIRLLLMIVAIALIAVINTCATLGWPEGRPLSVPRRRIVEAGSSLCRIIFFAFGYHIKVSGWENVQEAKRVKAVGVFNHVSYLDTLLLFWLFLPSGVSKRGNSRIPVIKHCIRCLNNIWVDDSRRGARATGSTNNNSSPGPNGDVFGSPSPAKSELKKKLQPFEDNPLARTSPPIQAHPTTNTDVTSEVPMSVEGHAHLTTNADCPVEGPMPVAFSDITNMPSRQGSSHEQSKSSPAPAVDQSNIPQAVAKSSEECDTTPPTPMPNPVVDSTAPTTAKSVTALITERVMDPLYCAPGGFPLLFIAPEGTVTNGQCLIKFKSGAFVMGRPVLPVLLKYPFKHLNAAYTEMVTPFHLLRLMCQWTNFLEVTILPPYIPSSEELADPALYANNVRKLMAEKLQVPLVDQEYAHCRAMTKKKIWMGWDGRKVVGPQAEIDEDLNIMLQLPASKAT